MTEFIATIYEWFGYAVDLGDHLRGFDETCTGFIGTNFYILIFFIMIGVSSALFIFQYFILNSVKFAKARHVWLIAIIGILINFGIGVSYPETVESCEGLYYVGFDLVLYGIANAFWGLIVFTILVFSPLRKMSRNLANTTLLKP